jgi:signal transduction histidine kinase
MNPSNSVTHAEIQAELIDTLFRSVPIAIVVHTVTSTVLVLMLWAMAPHDSLLAWLVILYALTVARWFLMRAYRRRRPTLTSTRYWGTVMTTLSWLFGSVWATVPILFLDPGQPETLIIITVILVGLNAQALMAVVSYPPAYFASILVLLSLAAVLLLRGGTVGAEIALLVSLNLVASLFYARNVYRTLNQSLQLRFENTALRRETEEKSALLETTLQHIQQGISLIDPENRLRMWNQRFLDLLGQSRRTVEHGQPLDTILHAADPPLALLKEEQVEYWRADGAIIEILQIATPNGSRVLTCTDISELKHREEALDAARQEAERANAAKTRFLATASHDLRQPIHALGLFFANLVDRVRDTETEPLIKQIEDSIGAIDSMLSALLDISKLDAGVVRPNIGSVVVADLFRRLEIEYQSHGINPFGTLRERRRFQRLETEYRSPAWENGTSLRMRPCRAIVQSDATMLERILRNLISNALRYTRGGRVLVGARCRGGKLRIEVYDNGPGIPEEQLDNIFLEFHQLGNPERDRHQGLGLGLAIVKRLAALLGHDITVRSRWGHGSCFAITVPLVRDSSCHSLSSTTTTPTKALRGHRVLVLDDDKAVLAAMEGLLERWGCAVIQASSLEEAREQLKATVSPPELLIVDYRLQGRASGLEAVAILQKALQRYVPALVITGDTAPDRLREAEASGYPLLHKPVQPAKLRSALHHLLHLRERELLG